MRKRKKRSKRPIVRGTIKNPLEQSVLESIKILGLDYGYETEAVVYPIPKTKRYIPDFVIRTAEGHKVYIEVKGWFRSQDRMKMLYVKQAHPDLDIRFVFKANNKLSSTSETRYSGWCEKHGFPYHIGTSVPKEWFTKRGVIKRKLYSTCLHT